MVTTEQHLREVREYYGRVLQGSRDLKTGACCTTESFPEEHRRILETLPGEILEKFYGCGSPIPPAVEGKTILDLGCGSGRDAYLLSRLAGPLGRVIGVDMTEEQIRVAARHVESQTMAWGFAQPNLEFRQGFIEDLAGISISGASIDIVVSNCVLNLSPDKEAVFREIFRVLKPGGELYFSDVFAGRRVPEYLRNDPVLRGECLAGALYVEDFRRLLRQVGCPDTRVVSRRPVAMRDRELENKIGMVDFHSITVRAFKLTDLEDLCEDYGQVATYRGTIQGHPHAFALDDHHLFQTGKPMLVCGNTASMISQTRFGKHFRVDGDRGTHFGLFDCAPAGSTKMESGISGACC